eukprot:Hpha_TRINITY_DN15771_c4_g1::TRINITY_DN15771_c4_g1_i1::g.40726::m.40726
MSDDILDQTFDTLQGGQPPAPADDDGIVARPGPGLRGMPFGDMGHMMRAGGQFAPPPAPPPVTGYFFERKGFWEKVARVVAHGAVVWALWTGCGERSSPVAQSGMRGGFGDM